MLVLPGSRARIVRCGGRYDPQLVKRSSEWVSGGGVILNPFSWFSSFCFHLRIYLIGDFFVVSVRTNTITLQGVSAKSSPVKLFGIFSLQLRLFCVKFCKFVGNSYSHISTNFCRFHQMAIKPRVPIVFTLSVFEYSPIKRKCRGRSPTAWFTQNGWANVVDSDCRLS